MPNKKVVSGKSGIPVSGILCVISLLVFLCIAPLAAGQKEIVYPGESWERITDPASAGDDPAKLEEARKYIEKIKTTGLVVVVGGRILFEYGDIEQVSYVASVRKSILAMLYGNYVEDGTIDLNETLEDLEMDDVGGLLPIEKKA
jgi:CubicO group peptidase (beta-lactamase class C family)